MSLVNFKGIFIFTTILSAIVHVHSKRSRKLENACTAADYHFDFTECDATGSRWRVAIPSTNCEGSLPQIPPKRLDECFKSCEAGQFLNLTTVECEDCEVGTYSLGGGLRFDEWDPLPNGFKSIAEKFHSKFSALGRLHSGDNCSRWGWRASQRDVLLSQGGPCVATLLYSAQLVKPGSLKFTYQYVDDSILFQFQANSDQCESIREAEKSRWPPLTGDGVWRTEEIPLHSGLNIFQWKTMGIDSHRAKPILIKKIEIDGVGYTSSCNPCPTGMFSNAVASKTCTPCPKNTFSSRKDSTTCTKCNDDEYADMGSSKCTPKPSCTATDYYQAHTPCDQNNKTRIVHKWVEPKICLESLSGSIGLPAPEPLLDCPPCNFGTEYKADGSCRPCPKNQYSDGTSPCIDCPPNTIPDTGHHLTQWYTWSPYLHTTCISPEDNGCNQSPAWQLTGKFVRSGKGHADWVYLVMTLTVGGFRGRGGMVNGELLEVGSISFEFEMKCSHDCELLFMQGTSSKNASVIQRWSGEQSRQEITHPIVRNDTYNFSWAFQKLAWDSASSDSVNSDDLSYTQWERTSAEDNHVKIFWINVTNSIDGGASSCIACKEGLVYSQDGLGGSSSCVTCSRGEHFSHGPNDTRKNGSLDEDTSQCLPCPSGMVTVDPFASNSSACRPCGPALITLNGLTCTTDCVVHLDEHTYDLTPLRGYHTVRGSSLFTASGTQYYHVFNISFCADFNAQCFKNVSLQHGYGSQNSRVEALICQSTVFPPAVGLSMDGDPNSSPYGYGEPKPLSTHASSLGDHLVGISHSPSILSISVAEDLIDPDKYPEQFHFFYSTPEQTIACSKGRSTTITFRCRLPSASWTGLSNALSMESNTIRTPDKCHDATCDGCNYHFIWETPFACHLCKEEDVRIVRGECKDGMQEVTYLPRNGTLCLMKFNASWPSTQNCKNHLPFVIEIAIQFAVGLTAVLSVLLICFWRRHRKLEYKYMKLVASGSNSGTGHIGSSIDSVSMERDMLPVAESCALDPDEQEDDEDNMGVHGHFDPRLSSQMKEVGFYSENAIKNLVGKFSILNKIKTLTRKSENGSNLEIMNLTDKETLS